MTYLEHFSELAEGGRELACLFRWRHKQFCPSVSAVSKPEQIVNMCLYILTLEANLFIENICRFFFRIKVLKKD